MSELNYHHLRYFHEVAKDGNLTRTAERLNVSQSALSTQIRTFEARIGHQLFERRGRQLVLTEVGHITLDYSERIFEAGEELAATLRQASAGRQAVRIGALSTLSRNFQIGFLAPLIGRTDVEIVLRSGNGGVLFEALQAMALDVVLTTEPPARDVFSSFVAHRVAEQKVLLHGTPHRLRHATLEEMLSEEPVILPTDSSIRTGFDSLITRLGLRPQVAAEVDDMAMIRLLAREDAGLAITPAVVLADELRDGLLVTAPFDLDIGEDFYAVTLQRRFPNPVVTDLIEKAREAEASGRG
ncbi:MULTISPECIES: LysR family transcriptional regulator [Thioclava]|uniref:LysR family transcriptional regulator n=1 Tax=Thioclava TaxID=285107 RepID=UPI000B543EFE|nr:MULTISPECIES: LysR family transcriptional regulator [Thioclava]OWY04471.1 LysR family transcriptional regulator [Thioclava sp. IC9]OWY05985.1 LysR family transcriptional regulator [Thioclava sp. F1Mire-8]OWY13646.1 LysR family transcriptional regulator [Thioclava sp. F34-6]PWE50927.1 LysR family transcriptional regulator [Thioclava sp. NG1]WGT51266.1 LysR family transcriptional regulator [Thioclava nitratireducens]